MKHIFAVSRILALLVVLVSGCKTGRIATTDTKPTEVIVFGKLSLESTKKLSNKNMLMHFNERLWGKYAVWLDDSGYFYTRLPLGDNHIALIEYREGAGFYKNIPDDYLTINLPSTENIYYIGDIKINWTPSKVDQRNGGGALGVMSEAKAGGEKLPVTVEQSAAAISYFSKKFPQNKKEIKYLPLKVKSNHDTH